MDQFSDPEEIRTDVLGKGYLVAGRYEIQRLLGTGGMGSVYLALDRILGEEQVAVKILHKQFAYEQKYTQRFLREIQLMRRVNHKNVVRTFDVGADGDVVYFTMEYVDGQSLLDLISTRTFPKEQLLTTIIQICEGLEAIHKANIIHRDLKPGNIILLADGTVKITDFGVARPETSELTAHNEVIGSSPYIAPEVWLGDKLTQSVDLYSLGIILYELNTGVLPFDAESPAQIMRMHLDRAPVPPRELNKTIPAWLNRLILKLLEKSPLSRPRDAREVIDYTVSNLDPNSSDPSAQTVLASYSSQPTVSNTFIAKLEAMSQRATDQKSTAVTKRDTQRLMAKIASWKLRVPSRSYGMSRLRDHVDHSRMFEALWKAIKALSYFFGLRIGMTVVVAAVLAAFLAGVSYLYNNLPELSTFVINQYDPTFGYAKKRVEWPALFKVGLPYTFLLVATLAAPVAFIGALSGSFRAALRSYLISLVAVFTMSLIIFLSHLIPAMSAKDEFQVTTIISTGAATGRQLAEVALLSPLITSIKQDDFMINVALSVHKVEPLTNSVLLSLLTLVYIGILVYCSRNALAYSSKRPDLAYLVLTIGLISLLLIEVPKDLTTMLTNSDTMTSFQLMHFNFVYAKPALRGILMNWAFIYFAVGFFIPIIGGTRRRSIG